MAKYPRRTKQQIIQTRLFRRPTSLPAPHTIRTLILVSNAEALGMNSYFLGEEDVNKNLAGCVAAKRSNLLHTQTVDSTHKKMHK
jgi:hypothetical protein